jgi:hypothetical protein
MVRLIGEEPLQLFLLNLESAERASLARPGSFNDYLWVEFIFYFNYEKF